MCVSWRLSQPPIGKHTRTLHPDFILFHLSLCQYRGILFHWIQGGKDFRSSISGMHHWGDVMRSNLRTKRKNYFKGQKEDKAVTARHFLKLHRRLKDGLFVISVAENIFLEFGTFKYVRISIHCGRGCTYLFLFKT